MTFFEFVSIVQRHFKNCEIHEAVFTHDQPSLEIKPNYYRRFTQVASVNGCKQEALRYIQNRTVFSFELEGVKFICDVLDPELLSC